MDGSRETRAKSLKGTQTAFQLEGSPPCENRSVLAQFELTPDAEDAFCFSPVSAVSRQASCSPTSLALTRGSWTTSTPSRPGLQRVCNVELGIPSVFGL